MKFSKFGKNKKFSKQKIYKIDKRGGPNKSGRLGFFFQKKLSGEGDVYSGPKSTLEKRIAITLLYLKDQVSLRVTANLFCIAKCTASVVVHEICSILAKIIAPDSIRFLIEKDDLSETARKFLKRFGFP